MGNLARKKMVLVGARIRAFRVERDAQQEVG